MEEFYRMSYLKGLLLVMGGLLLVLLCVLLVLQL
jgi:hypothetical protein